MALRVKNLSEILADDVCLGKTLTILALMADYDQFLPLEKLVLDQKGLGRIWPSGPILGQSGLSGMVEP